MRNYSWELHIYAGQGRHRLLRRGTFVGSETQSMAKLMATFRATLRGERIVGPRWRLHRAESVVGDISGRVYIKQRRTRPGVKNVNPITYLYVGKKVNR